MTIALETVKNAVVRYGLILRITVQLPSCPFLERFVSQPNGQNNAFSKQRREV